MHLSCDLRQRSAATPRWAASFAFLVAAFLHAAAPLWAETQVRLIADNLSYNSGDAVRLRVVPSGAENLPAGVRYLITIRYAGDSHPVLDRVPLPSPQTKNEDDYREVWKVPADARTGRYTIDLTALDSTTRRESFNLPQAASFAVHRKLVKVERVELGKTFYTSGDPVACRVVLKNLAGHDLKGLRVEFSERYWPWIAQTSERAGVDVFTIVKDLTLAPGKELEVRSARAAAAKSVTQASVQQYAVVVWDAQRQTAYDIAFSSLTFIQPPGDATEKPYPLQYVFPSLKSVDTTSYRQFDRAESGSTAIQFDRARTMYAPGDAAVVKFAVINSTDQDWKGARIQASLRALGSAEFERQVVGESVDIPARVGRLEQKAKLTLPSDGAGTYRVVVEVTAPGGQTLASGTLEITANPLPKSILIFCAHEDDEGAHAGIIRAAVENHIPIHLVYFTSGDSGSCDRYYDRSCGPAEALNFGALRMEEARTSLDHLGVPRENIFFLGLPDGGSGEIWYRHIESSNPYLSVLLASDHAPYDGLARPNLPFSRRAAVDAAKEFIKEFQPEVIYTGHPDERHVDHRTNNWFVVEALQELLQKGAISPATELRVDQVYGPGPQKHAPYRYERQILHVPAEVWARAQEAQWFYQSQSGNRALGKIRSFGKMPGEEIHWRVLDWKEHAGWNEKD